MDKHDKLVLSVAAALKARWHMFKALRSIGDAQRAARLLLDELAKRGLKVVDDGKKLDAPTTP